MKQKITKKQKKTLKRSLWLYGFLLMFLPAISSSLHAQNPATIWGEVSTSEIYLTYDVPYTITAAIYSSKGTLYHPRITLTIPAGQKYIPGSGKIEYPLDTLTSLPAALESALTVLDGNQNSPTSVLLDFSSIVSSLPGYLDTGNYAQKIIMIHADFSPQCLTPQAFFRYRGQLQGENSDGTPATNNNLFMFSEQMAPISVKSINYFFNMGIEMADGNYAFNEQRTTGTLIVSISKCVYQPEDMQPTDQLLLVLPKEFNISGNAAITSDFGLGAVTTESNTVIDTERYICLSLPIAAFNSDTGKGHGIWVDYEIPLVYTPNGQTLAPNPKQIFYVTTTTELPFSPNCNPSPTVTGGHNIDIAVITASENTATACLNTAKTLEITSAGFSGSWYDDASKTTELSNLATYSYTPTSQTTGGRTFYVCAKFHWMDYGMVPVIVTMNPEATLTVTPPAAQCSSTSSFNLGNTVSGTPSGSTVRFYTDATGTTELTSTTVAPTATITYYAQGTTVEGCQSELTPVQVNVTQTPSMTTPSNRTFSPGATTAVSLSGTNVTHYTWSGGNDIGLSDNSGTGQTQIPSFTAVNTGASPVTRTITVTPQNTANSVTCSGTPVTFDITVNSSIITGSFANQSGCASATHPAISASGSMNVAYYKWSGGSSVGLADNTGTTQTQIPPFTLANVTSTTTATITVTPYTSGNFAGTPTTFDITVYPLPVITLGHNKPATNGACLNTDATFTTEAGKTNYVWNLGGATTTSGGTATSNTAVLKWNTPGSKTVTVNYTDANGCSAAAATQKTITVLPATAITVQPSVDPSVKFPNGSIIMGSNVALDVTAAGHNLTYQWYWKKASDGSTVSLTDNSKYTGSTTPNLVINNVCETDNGEYYVTVTGTCNTDTSYPITIVSVENQDASLKDLKVNGTTPSDFNPSKTDYLITVKCSDDQVTLLGTPNNTNYTSITGNETYNLNVGNNYLTITVVSQDMVTTMNYTVNVVRDCSTPRITKDLEDAIVCVGESHTFEILAEGEYLAYEWYRGNNRILNANSNTYTVMNVEPHDYERYYAIVRNIYNGSGSSVYSKNASLWVADNLPETLLFLDYPNPAITGKTYHIKLAGYSDVTKYNWSYRANTPLPVDRGENDGVTFSPETGAEGENETWATFGTLAEGTGILTATLEHPCGTREAAQTITVKYPTGTDNVTGTTVQVSPNPTSGLVKVSDTESNRLIRIIDVTGSLKGTYPTQEGTTTIDLTGYAKGTYMLQYNGKIFKVIRI